MSLLKNWAHPLLKNTEMLGPCFL